MKKFILFFFLSFIYTDSFTQILPTYFGTYKKQTAGFKYGTVNEHQTLTLTAPSGMTFSSVTFASYGTPNGSSGNYTIGGCHANNSITIVQNACIGNNSCSVWAKNSVFGDPCVGTFKRLYIKLAYN